MATSVPTRVQSQEHHPSVVSWSKIRGVTDSFTGEMGQPSWSKLKESEKTAHPGFDKDEREQIASNGEKAPQKSIPRKLLEELPLEVGNDLQKLDEKAERIIRVHFADQILADLRRIQKVCGRPAAAVYASGLLQTIRRMGEVLPYDPLIEILMALHDALAFENRWVDFGAAQYAKAYDLIKLLAHQKLRANQVEKAIMALEDIGFDTTPIPLDSDGGE